MIIRGLFSYVYTTRICEHQTLVLTASTQAHRFGELQGDFTQSHSQTHTPPVEP